MKKLSDQFYVGPQIEIDDIEDLQISGIKSVICLRPDGEGAGQPAFEALKTQATSLEIAAHYLPIVPGQISNAQIAEFAIWSQKAQVPFSPIAAAACAQPPFGLCIKPNLGNPWMIFLRPQNLLDMI
jgi:uncharacterized protein (TIGR01244 family)